jgi:uncharacterized membrane protein (UPF0127 family)
MKHAYLRAITTVLSIALPACVHAASHVVSLTLPSGKVLQTEVMVSSEERAMGLMFRPSLPADHGMLFLFEAPDFHAIWMKNCKFPIDIVWLDADHKVVDVAEAVPPCTKEPCPVYTPLRKASYVVEINAGQAKKEKATLGAALSFTLPPEITHPR